MLGQPKFKREDQVKFTIEMSGKMKTIEGVIYIVDPNGTFESAVEER